MADAHDLATFVFVLNRIEILMLLPICFFCLILYRKLRNPSSLTMFVGLLVAILAELGWYSFERLYPPDVSAATIPVYAILAKIVFDLGLLTAGIGFAKFVLSSEWNRTTEMS